MLANEARWVFPFRQIYFFFLAVFFFAAFFAVFFAFFAFLAMLPSMNLKSVR
jgi:hypothetical protein